MSLEQSQQHRDKEQGDQALLSSSEPLNSTAPEADMSILGLFLAWAGWSWNPVVYNQMFPDWYHLPHRLEKERVAKAQLTGPGF